MSSLMAKAFVHHVDSENRKLRKRRGQHGLTCVCVILPVEQEATPIYIYLNSFGGYTYIHTLHMERATTACFREA